VRTQFRYRDRFPAPCAQQRPCIEEDLRRVAVRIEQAPVRLAQRLVDERLHERARGAVGVSVRSFLVLDDGKVMTESDGSLHVMAALGGIWRLTAAGRIVPKPVRDWLYRVLARNRYNWFGKRDTCYLP
jgi:predicted DCC family thiol-disulfide oxidoreductase YuxK